MPSRVLETVLTGRNLLSPVLTGAARDVEAYDAKVTAASTRAGESTVASAKVQETSAAKVIAANTRTATSSEAMSAKIAASQAKASESSRAFADVSQSSAARSAAAWSSLATKGLPLAAAAVAVVTGKMAADFQTNIVKLETTAGESNKNLGLVSRGLLDMTGQVGVSATTLAKGAYTVESAGFHGRDALLVMKAAAQGAAQEQADLTKVTDAVTTALHDYNLPASDAARVTSQMVTAVSHGKTTFDELTGSLHSVTPLAAALHVPLADILGDLSAMTASGESADQATQNMADALRHLQNPTSIMTGELAQLGITSSDLAGDLSSKGLSGTIQEIEQAILQHLDPATQRVLLPAFNQSKLAAQDLNTMLGHMPPTLAKLSQGLLDGSVSFKDYRTKVRDLGGQAEVLGTNFLGLFQSSQGFNQQLKNGGPAAQVFSAALQKAMGDSSGLTVALQLTGDHAATVNGSIKDIAKSAGDAQGNIRGWDEVQGTFNQKLHEAGAAAGAMAIQVGQHVLPVLSSTVGWIGSTGIPGIEHLASGVGNAVHWFTQLPGPIRDAALALLAVKVAARSDLFAGLIASGRVLAFSFANSVGNTVATVRAGTAQISASYAEAAAAARLSATIQGESMASVRIAGAMAGTTAAAKVLATQGFGAVTRAGAGVVRMLGGPMGIALIGATLLWGGMNAAMQHGVDTENKWVDALKAGGQAESQARGEMALTQQKVDQLTTGFSGFANKVFGFGQVIAATAPKAQDATDAYQKWYDSLDRVGKAQEAVTKATSHYNDVVDQYGPASSQAQAAAGVLQQANQNLKRTQDDVNTATQTHLSLLQQQSDAELASVNSSLAAMEAQGQLDSAIAQYNLDAKDGQHTTAQLKQESAGLAQQAITTAQAVAQHAADQAKANGVTDTSIVYNNTLHDTLVTLAGELTGPARQAVLDAANAIDGATVKTNDFQDATKKLGLNVAATWPAGTKVVQDATTQQIDALKALGYHVTTLPGSDPNKPQTIYVTTDTSAAYTGLTEFLKKAQDLGFVGALHGLAPIGHGNPGNNGGNPIGLPPINGPGHADGGYTGPGAKFTPAGIVHAGEIVWSQADIAAHGGVGTVEAMRTARPGYADGGLVFPAEINPSILSSWNGYLSSLSSFSGTGAGSPFMRILGQSIAAGMGYGGQFGAIDYIFSRESGWNPLAQNPTSTAFGIPQFLDSTWGPYGGKTTDAAQQIRDGIEYMVNRYGSPNAAAAFWAAHHWYGNGGVVNGAQLVGVGESGPEAIVPLNDPARRDAVMAQAGLAAPAMPGYGTPFSGAVFGPGGPVNVSAQVRVFLGDREITDIVRVEATAVVDAELGALADSLHYSGN